MSNRCSSITHIRLIKLKMHLMDDVFLFFPAFNINNCLVENVNCSLISQLTVLRYFVFIVTIPMLYTEIRP